MPSGVRYTKTQLTKSALHYAVSYLDGLIDAYTTKGGEVTDTETVAEFKSLRNQMQAYRKKRFGPSPDPLEGAVLVDVITELKR